MPTLSEANDSHGSWPAGAASAGLEELARRHSYGSARGAGPQAQRQRSWPVGTAKAEQEELARRHS